MIYYTWRSVVGEGEEGVLPHEHPPDEILVDVIFEVSGGRTRVFFVGNYLLMNQWAREMPSLHVDQCFAQGALLNLFQVNRMFNSLQTWKSLPINIQALLVSKLFRRQFPISAMA